MNFRPGPLHSATPSKDRRHDRRQKLYSEAWVEPEDCLTPILCRVVDISHTGARLGVAKDAQLPENVTLCVGRTRREAKVVWRTPTECGLEFVTPKLDVDRRQPKQATPSNVPQSEGLSEALSSLRRRIDDLLEEE